MPHLLDLVSTSCIFRSAFGDIGLENTDRDVNKPLTR